MNLPTVLIVVGGVLFLSGHGLFAASFFQGVNDSSATIPPGPQWFLAYEIKVLASGRVFGQFNSPAGATVRLFVFNATQRDVFASSGSGPNLYVTQAVSGSFSVLLPLAGTYYLVLGHGDASQDSGQAVLVSYRVAGVQPDLLSVAMPFIAAGIVAVGIGLSWRNRHSRLVFPDKESSH